ncbi:MAG: hypothetical protein QM520_04755 [Gammaproteobacteria bacterium]|nr:hypothetical protein [Gammaproteobacteria bacterium]
MDSATDCQTYITQSFGSVASFAKVSRRDSSRGEAIRQSYGSVLAKTEGFFPERISIA